MNMDLIKYKQHFNNFNNKIMKEKSGKTMYINIKKEIIYFNVQNLKLKDINKKLFF